MKIQMRTGVFETNSSSVHSMTICMEEDYKAFENGKKYICIGSLKLYDTIAEGMAHERWADKEDFMMYEDYMDYVHDTLYNEEFEETFKTPHGEKVVAFGYYGYDG